MAIHAFKDIVRTGHAYLPLSVLVRVSAPGYYTVTTYINTTVIDEYADYVTEDYARHIAAVRMEIWANALEPVFQAGRASATSAG